MNVEGRVIVLGLALLRFREHGTIHEHPGENDVLVACLDGRGFTSLGEETHPIEAGEYVLWPQGVPHRLWTEDSTMVTLMVDPYRAPDP